MDLEKLCRFQKNLHVIQVQVWGLFEKVIIFNLHLHLIKLDTKVVSGILILRQLQYKRVYTNILDL